MRYAEDEIRRMLETDPDFIALRRFGHSLKRLEERYPDGCPDHVLAGAMAIAEADVETRHNEIIIKMRRSMRVED